MNPLSLSFYRGFRKQSLLSAFIAVGVGCLLPLLLGGTALAQSQIGKSEGADIDFGGQGTGNGQFTILQDITFDPQGNLYTLEAGGSVHVGAATNPDNIGVARVQKFDSTGKYLSQFPLGADITADPKKGLPFRIAADSQGDVFVTFPLMNIVRQFGPDGKLVRDWPLPGASAVALDRAGGKERIAAIGSNSVARGISLAQVVKADGAGDKIWLFDPKGGDPQSITLAKPLVNPISMTTDKDGHFYVLADTYQIYCLDPTGAVLKIIGSGSTKPFMDGSRACDAVGVDSKGNIYSETTNTNPVQITMYTADGKNVLQHAGQFHYADGWGWLQPSQTVPMAVSPDDRVWVAATRLIPPGSTANPPYHFGPAIVRTDKKFFDPRNFLVKVTSTTALGFTQELSNSLLSGVTTDLSPIKENYIIAPAIRNVKEVSVAYHVYDYAKTEITSGTVKLPLQDSVEASTSFSFTPPRYGWYVVEAEATDTASGAILGGVCQFVGVTPVYTNMPAKPEDFHGGWIDVPRQAFVGLNAVRLAPGDPKDHYAVLEKAVADGKQYGVNYWVQLVDNKAAFTPEALRPIIEQFKGRIPVYELFNEPNFAFSPADFVAAAKPVYQMIKEVDPQAKVMGPSFCGMNLGWLDAFYKAGGASVCDIIALHDYEGNQAITPEHWRWKVPQVRALMAKYNDGDKELWQTERAIEAVRAGFVYGGTQAVRCLVERNLMVSMGVASDHNAHYYLNQGGYAHVASYVWENAGPHPAALALRTREALTKGKKYDSEIDFGTTGNKMLLGLRFSGADGKIVSLENFGTSDMPYEATLTGGTTVDIVDSFGNAGTLTAKDGKLALSIPQLPIYLKLKPDQDVTFPKLEPGKNIAPAAQVIYSEKSNSDISILNNGILETHESEDPNGDPAGNGIGRWAGDVMLPGRPQTVDLHWAQPRSISGVTVFSAEMDNGGSALLDYDVQAWEDGAWKTVAQVRTPIRATDTVTPEKGDATAVAFLQNENFYISQFPAVTTDKIRIVALRTSFGFCHDEGANAAMYRAWGSSYIPSLVLREIEVYSAPGAVQIAASVPEPRKTAAFASDTATVNATNSGSAEVKGVVRPTLPDGWTADPASAPVSIPAGGKTSVTFALKPPAAMPTGRIALDFTLEDDKGATLDQDTLQLIVSSPAVLRADTPGAPDKDGEHLNLKIGNLTHDPLSGTARVEFEGPQKIDPIEMPFGPIDPGATMPSLFIVPNLNLTGGRWILHYNVTANGLTARLSQNLATHVWSVIGPFDNEQDTVYGPETEVAGGKVDITKDYTDAFGGSQKWKTVSDDSAGKLNFNFGQVKDGTAYAAVWITSPKAQKAVYWGGINGTGKLWVNGKQVCAREQSQSGLVFGIDHGDFDLKEGTNVVLMKVNAGRGGWAFLFDLLDPTTQKSLPDLIYSPEPPK